MAAALDLFGRYGYEAVTVAQVADAAGVTSRTYFRQFPDKREVLFGGAESLRRQVAAGLREAPADLGPFAAVVRAVASCDPLFVPDERGRLRRRGALIATSEELRERETLKLSVIADDLAAGLAARHVPPEVASLVADLGVVVLKEVSRAGTQERTARSPSQLWGAAASFPPGTRTPWKTNAAGQTVVVTGGAGRAQSEGAEVVEIGVGDLLWFEPGVRHWEGAAPDQPMTYVAMHEDGVDFGEAVTDDEYGALG